MTDLGRPDSSALRHNPLESRRTLRSANLSSRHPTPTCPRMPLSTLRQSLLLLFYCHRATLRTNLNLLLLLNTSCLNQRPPPPLRISAGTPQNFPVRRQTPISCCGLRLLPASSAARSVPEASRTIFWFTFSSNSLSSDPRKKPRRCAKYKRARRHRRGVPKLRSCARPQRIKIGNSTLICLARHFLFSPCRAKYAVACRIELVV